MACSAAGGRRTAAPRLVIVRVVEDGKEDVERNAALVAASGEMLIDGAMAEIHKVAVAERRDEKN